MILFSPNTDTVRCISGNENSSKGTPTCTYNCLCHSSQILCHCMEIQASHWTQILLTVLHMLIVWLHTCYMEKPWMQTVWKIGWVIPKTVSIPLTSIPTKSTVFIHIINTIYHSWYYFKWLNSQQKIRTINVSDNSFTSVWKKLFFTVTTIWNTFGTSDYSGTQLIQTPYIICLE